MTPNTRRGLPAAAACALLAACMHTPPAAPLEPAATLARFNARTLPGLSGGLPAASAGWDRSQWLSAALQLNPQLGEQRAAVLAAAAAERSAAEHPNPGVELFAEYLTTSAQSTAWLYGVSLDFLLRRPGERARARQQAALQAALAQSELAESIWQVRAALRQALLDAVSARDETALLEALIAQRQALVDSDRARVQLGDLARTQMLADELELARARQRRQQSRTRAADAIARLAAAVGVPSTALASASVRWDDWAAIGALQSASSERWRTEALIGRPQITHALRETLKKTKSVDDAVLKVVSEAFKESAPVRFEGNNYAEEWIKEAKKRGLPNIRSTPDALKELISKQSRTLLTKLGVLTTEELDSRYQVRVERYVKDMLIELHTMREMVDTMIMPAAYAYLGELSHAASQSKSAGIAVIPQITTANQVGELVQELQEHREDLSDVIARAEAMHDDPAKQADLLTSEGADTMAEVRKACDALELLVRDSYWPLPKYREMLFPV